MNIRQNKVIAPVKKTAVKKITIILAPNSKMPTVAGKWERLRSGSIRAWYTLDEYALCLKVFEARKEFDSENNRQIA